MARPTGRARPTSGSRFVASLPIRQQPSSHTAPRPVPPVRLIVLPMGSGSMAPGGSGRSRTPPCWQGVSSTAETVRPVRARPDVLIPCGFAVRLARRGAPGGRESGESCDHFVIIGTSAPRAVSLAGAVHVGGRPVPKIQAHRGLRRAHACGHERRAERLVAPRCGSPAMVNAGISTASPCGRRGGRSAENRHHQTTRHPVTTHVAQPVTSTVGSLPDSPGALVGALRMGAYRFRGRRGVRRLPHATGHPEGGRHALATMLGRRARDRAAPRRTVSTIRLRQCPARRCPQARRDRGSR